MSYIKLIDKVKVLIKTRNQSQIIDLVRMPNMIATKETNMTSKNNLISKSVLSYPYEFFICSPGNRISKIY